MRRIYGHARHQRRFGSPALVGLLPTALLLVSISAHSQEPDREADSADASTRFDEPPRIQFNLTRAGSPRVADEEVIVQGQMPPSGYRRRAEAAVEATWAAFNEANSDDQFDVHCRYEARTGTRILQHVCRPKFLDDATSRAARAMLQLDKAASFGLQQIEAARAFYLQRRMGDELRGLAMSDPALQEQLEILDEELEAYEEARRGEPTTK